MTTEQLAKDFITANEAWLKASLIASTTTDKTLCKNAAELWLKKDEAYKELKERVL